MRMSVSMNTISWERVSDLTPQSNHSPPSSPEHDSSDYLLLGFVPLTQPISGFVFPVLAFITMITNLLVCIVLLKKHMRNNCTNIILIAMAVSDTMTGLVPLPCYIYFYSLGHYLEYVPHSWCFIYYSLTDYLPTIFHTASVWLTVALAGQRYLYVCHPGRAKRLCTIKNVLRLIASIYIVSTISQFWRFVEFQYTPVVVPSYVQQMKKSMTSSHDVTPDSLRYSESTLTSFIDYDVMMASQKSITTESEIKMVSACRYEISSIIRPHQNLFYNVNFWFRVVFVHLISCTSLVLLSASLIRTMRRARTRRAALTMRPTGSSCVSGACHRLNGSITPSSRRSGEDSNSQLRQSCCTYCIHRRPEGRSTTLMLVTVVWVFLLVESPLAVFIIINVIENTFQIQLFHLSTTHLITLLLNLFTLISYPVNFFIYCGMSRQFRRTFKNLFVCPVPYFTLRSDMGTELAGRLDGRTAAYRRAQRYMPMPLEPRR